MSNKLLDIQDLKMYIYSWEGVVKAVDGVDMEIGENEIVGLVGESGSGKSMTSLSVMKLLPPRSKVISGRILFKDLDLINLSEKEMRNIRGKDISLIFQNPSTFLNPVLRIGDQIIEPIMLHHRKKKKEAKQEGIELLRSTGIPSPDIVFKYYPHQLSGGMRQRVMIAMASACKPSLLIADEATTELDVTTQLQILESLKKSVATRGYSLLIITHNLGVIANMCERIYVMYAGKIMEVANLFDLFEKPKHPYTIGLLESTLSTEKSKEELVSIKGSVPDLTNLPAGCRFHPRCPRAMDKCRERNPVPIQIGPEHWVSCLLND